MEEKINRYCTFYLVRHGETEWNVMGLLQGQKDTPLTQTGINQAKLLGKKLKAIHFDAVFSSDLLRAKRTAELITLERQIAVITRKILREKAFGPFEGMPGKAMYKKLAKMFAKMERMSKNERFGFKYHREVESDEEIFNRLNIFIREAAVAYAGKTVLVVTHGAIIRSFLLKLGYASYHERLYIKNTAYVKLLSDGVDYFIKETVGIEKNPQI